ncbi:MAG: YqcC family protein [Sedimenticolaceae bacterium]
MRDRLRVLLNSLESELRLQGRWDSLSPPEAALRSTQPFAVDTLEFDQWLQWILLPKLHDLLLRQQPLPASCAIEPMAEECYGPDDPTTTRIVSIIAQIDALLNESEGDLN